ncbi:hypothetical protein QBC34DRAFT_283866, partial [Podospora aff. communis PSN243]
ALREQSYAAGWERSQLPNTVGSMGVDPGFINEMPVLDDGISPRLAFWHQGSQVGATAFVMLLQETESATLVLTNTMAPNDAAAWIGRLLVETLSDGPVRNDDVRLASASVDSAIKSMPSPARGLKMGGSPEDRHGLSAIRLSVCYPGFGGPFRIHIRQDEKRLEMLFKGRESQKYQLEHHHGDTFTWFMSWNEQIKRGRFINLHPPY